MHLCTWKFEFFGACKLPEAILVHAPFTSMFSCVYFSSVVRFKIYSFSKFQVYSTALLTIVTILYITSPGLTHFKSRSLYLFKKKCSFPYSLQLHSWPHWHIFVHSRKLGWESSRNPLTCEMSLESPIAFL